MAKETIVRLIDDLDKGEADETVRFGIDGTDYEIDLSAENAGRLREVLAEFAAVARRVPAGRRPGRRPGRKVQAASAPAEAAVARHRDSRDYQRELAANVKAGEPGPAASAASGQRSNAAVRHWWWRAHAAGLIETAPSERGRIPDHVRAACERYDGAVPEAAVEVPDQVREAEKPSKPSKAPSKPSKASKSKPSKAPGAPDMSTWTAAQRRDYRDLVRRWAEQNGYAVGSKGRISAEVYTAYEASL